MAPIKVQIDGTLYSVRLNTIDDIAVNDLTTGAEYSVWWYAGEWHFQRYEPNRGRRGSYVAIKPRTSHKLCARLKQAIEKAERAERPKLIA